jgi:glycosyltransferase involved in cell wall biosynthesis
MTHRGSGVWPDKFDFHGATAIRFPQQTQRGWSRLSPVAAMGKWLVRQRDDLDWVWVFHEAPWDWIRGASHADLGIGFRVDDSTSPCPYSRWDDRPRPRWGMPLRLASKPRLAVCIAASAPLLEQRCQGLPFHRIVVAEGMWDVPERNERSVSETRDALAQSVQMLQLAPGEKLVLFAGAFDSRVLEWLIALWARVHSAHRGARLWIVGAAPFPAAAWRELSESKLAASVTVAGGFDDVTAAFLAADVLVAPPGDRFAEPAVRRAAAVGLPVVSGEEIGRRLNLVAPQGSTEPPSAWCRDTSHESWAAGILNLLRDARLAITLGSALRERAQRWCSFQETAGAYLAAARTRLVSEPLE